MKINFLTLFPNYYKVFQSESIIKKAIDKKLVQINIVDFRAFSNNKHSKVDDVVYGGGKGMLLKVEPIDKALKTVKGKKILLSPQGKVFNQQKAKELSKLNEVTFIAGHYEGFDERVRLLVDEEISIGDFVLTNGELPSMIIADAIIRLIPNVIQEDSHLNDSFANNLLDFPQYTRPQTYKKMKVPEVLLSGNHKEIAKWRKQMQFKNTKEKRPDLLKGMKNEK